MSNNFKLNFKCYLITIEDSAALPGKSIHDVISTLQKIIELKFIIVDQIEGALISPLAEKENTIMALDDFFKLLPGIKQFDWGDFYLFKEYPINWNICDSESYSDVVAQTDTTVRAVDDTYIYIYTPYEEIVNVIKKYYEIESLKYDVLDRLDYPE